MTRLCSLRLACVAVGSLGGLSACGDPMLPSDYAGPPASAVSGNVIAPDMDRAVSKDAARPRLALEWLEKSGEMLQQPLAYERSSKLQNDWDIGLELPAKAATFSDSIGNQREIRLAVGKMVYFDDRVPDGVLDWGCSGAGCDVVKAVSAQFVVFVEKAPSCYSPTGAPVRPPVSTGYHYFEYEGGVLRDVGTKEPVRFILSDKSLAEANPARSLRTFAQALLRLWNVSLLEDC